MSRRSQNKKLFFVAMKNGVFFLLLIASLCSFGTLAAWGTPMPLAGTPQEAYVTAALGGLAGGQTWGLNRTRRALVDPVNQRTVGGHFTNGAHNHGADVANYTAVEQQLLITLLSDQLLGALPANTTYRQQLGISDISIPIPHATLVNAVAAVNGRRHHRPPLPVPNLANGNPINFLRLYIEDVVAMPAGGTRISTLFLSDH